MTALRAARADVFADTLHASDLDVSLSTAATLFVPDDDALLAVVAGASSDERRALLERHLILGSQLREFDLESFAVASSPLPPT